MLRCAINVGFHLCLATVGVVMLIFLLSSFEPLALIAGMILLPALFWLAVRDERRWRERNGLPPRDNVS